MVLLRQAKQEINHYFWESSWSEILELGVSGQIDRADRNRLEIGCSASLAVGNLYTRSRPKDQKNFSSTKIHGIAWLLKKADSRERVLFYNSALKDLQAWGKENSLRFTYKDSQNVCCSPFSQIHLKNPVGLLQRKLLCDIGLHQRRPARGCRVPCTDCYV